MQISIKNVITLFKFWELISGCSWCAINSNANIQMCYALHIFRFIDRENGIIRTYIED